MRVPSLHFEPLFILFANSLTPHRPADSPSCVLIQQVSRLELCLEQSLMIWGIQSSFEGQNSHSMGHPLGCCGPPSWLPWAQNQVLYNATLCPAFWKI